MSDKLKISIVTPSFNQGQFIEETILSVLDQGYPNLEYIIVDGGSTDNTVEIIKKYEKHLKWWVSEKDRGQSHAINKGLAKCTGDIFNWINSDDYYNGNVFEKVNQAFENPEVKLFGGCSHIFGGEKEWVSDGTKLPDPLQNIWVHPSIDQPATFFRKSMIDEFGYLTESLHYTMDLEWLLKYWVKYGIDGFVKTSDVFIHFREHGASKTVNFQEKFANERLKIYRSILSNFNSSIKILDEYKFKMPENSINKEWIIKTFNRYVYMELQRYYGLKWFKKFNAIYDLLDLNFLNDKEREMVIRQKKRAYWRAFITK